MPCFQFLFSDSSSLGPLGSPDLTLRHPCLWSTHAWEGGVGPGPPCRAAGAPVLAEVIVGIYGAAARRRAAVRCGGKWHNEPDKWRSLRWKSTSTGCVLFCFFLYRVSVLILLFLLMLSLLICADLMWGPDCWWWLNVNRPLMLANTIVPLCNMSLFYLKTTLFSQLR